MATIRIETPFEQVVTLGQSALNIDVQGAEQQLQNQALPVVVRVGVVTSATYTDSLVNPVKLSRYRYQISTTTPMFS